MDFNQWLEQEGLSILAELFAANHIDDVEILAELNDAELEAIGIPIGSRKKIQKALVGQGLRVTGAQTAVPQTPPQQQATSDLIPHQTAPASKPPVQRPAAPANAQQHVELQPAHPAPQAMEEPPPHLASPASSPQAQAVQATRHQPKAKNSRKATAIMIAIGVHVGIILLATTLTIFAASKDEPEIIATIAPPAATPQQEMKKKTVQKQVKQAPSSASAAAAPMAIMMKANAEARFTTPDVTRTSTGPLGMGEGDLGSGAFGVGTGLGDGGGGGMFMGTSTSGNMAVVFDITNSMKEALPVVVKEIQKAFKDSQVVCVFGGGFKRGDQNPTLIPYKKTSLCWPWSRSIPEGLLKLLTSLCFP